MDRNPACLYKTLVVGVIVLFIGVGINPAFADIVKESYIPLSKGKTLHVGGTGEGNYTKIQDVTNQVYPLGIAFMKTYGGKKNEGGKFVCQTTDGGYIITGTAYIDENNGVDVWLIKTDNMGNMVWNKTLGETNYD